ncbi:phosphate-starvation-inducible protein PsiE [Methylocystis bryophila]|uniref:Protein PsiE n=2 Tax=Methylocystis bryophila TaxID=655015 RepID=A0A1W6N1A3_9HYPH|nr:phosphate-starvation-inducible protein PsiE [Methylocystis bryophila]
MTQESPDPRLHAVRRMREILDPLGYFASEGFHLLGLFAILAVTFVAGAQALMRMAAQGVVSIEDLLLLFIYLEIASMVGIYFRTNAMPVRFLLYVGITALTRHMIGYVQLDSSPDAGVLILAGATLILALAVLVVRYASAVYGSREGNREIKTD